MNLLLEIKTESDVVGGFLNKAYQYVSTNFIGIINALLIVVLGYAVIELYLGVSGSLDGVAHFAHLGGMLFGLVLILYWRKNRKISGPYV